MIGVGLSSIVEREPTPLHLPDGEGNVLSEGEGGEE